DWGRFGAQRTDLSCRLPALREKFRQPPQVDRRHGHGEYQLGALEAAQFQLSQRAVLLAIAEDGFDQLAHDLTPRIAGMASGALIDGAGAVLRVPGDMRRYAKGTAVSHEVSRVIAF